MNYEHAINQAKASAVSIPEFAGLEAQVSARREARVGRDQSARLRARRWLYVAIVAFGLVPADVLLQAWVMEQEPHLQGIAVAVMLPMLMLAWGARVVTRPSFAAQVLVRSIAASNLLVALLLALAVGGVFGAVSQIVIAVSCARVLSLLGDRGLDTNDENSSFTPVAFRGFLILALIMAFADAQTLMFSALTQGSYLLTDGRTLQISLAMAPTLLAAGVMVLNVWGLFRLRTWAMLLNIIANLVIARLALTGVLGVNIWVAASLSLTAAVQLMLPVPILATWIGDRNAGGGGWRRGATLLRACVPVAVAVTMGAAVTNLGLARMWGWLDGNVGATAQYRGFSYSARPEVTAQLEQGDQVSGKGASTVAYGPRLRPGLTFTNAGMSGCDMSGADATELLVKAGDFRDAVFDGAKLSRSIFVAVDLTGASFRDAELEGVMFADCKLDAVDWVGATCPDGFVATAEEGCLAHLSHPRRVEAQDAARWMGQARLPCELSSAPEQACDALSANTNAELVARGEDLAVEWGPRLARREFVLTRESGTIWANPMTSVRVVAVPTPKGEVEVLVSRVHGQRIISQWIARVSRADEWRAHIRNLSGPG